MPGPLSPPTGPGDGITEMVRAGSSRGQEEAQAPPGHGGGPDKNNSLRQGPFLHRAWRFQPEPKGTKYSDASNTTLGGLA